MIVGLPCAQVDCAAVGIWRVFWPGAPPSLMCEEHVNKARAVAKAMGFHLHVETFVFLFDPEVPS